MKQSHYKHTVKLRTKQPDLTAYLIRLFLGALPLIIYYFTMKILIILKEVNINLSLPENFFLIACLIFLFNIFFTWFTSPLSFSNSQRIKNTLRKIIEVNKFYYENKELNKIISSMIIKFCWIDKKLYLEVYPNGGQYTQKMNELTLIFQTALNMSVIAVQDDYANHTTYILANESSNFINATDDWN